MSVGRRGTVADIRCATRPLKGIEIPIDQVPLAIDEFPCSLWLPPAPTGRLPSCAGPGVAGQDIRPHPGHG